MSVLLIGLGVFNYINILINKLMDNFEYPLMLNYTERREYESYVLSIIHACIISYCSYYDIMNNWVFYFMMSYFLNDIIRMILVADPKSKNFKKDDFMHHTIGFLLSGFCTTLNPDGPYFKYIAKIKMIEFSTIFLSTGFLLRGVKSKKRKLNYIETKVLKLNIVIFFLLFFALRIVWMPYVIIQILLERDLYYSIKILLVIMQGLQFHWFKIIYRNTKKFIRI